MIVITGEGLKTLDAVRGTFETHTIDPTRRGVRDARPPRRSRSDGRDREDPDAAALRRRGEPRHRSRARPCSEVLDGLFERPGELRERIADEDGSLRRFVNVYVAGEDIRFLDGLQTPVADGAELTILPAVAGGCH